MKNYKVRFNLGRGANYLKWKVTSPNGKVNYYEPNDVCLHMENCKLVNQQGTAQKIFDGANKTVCAWIECEALTIFEPLVITKGTKISYNPRVQPNWVCDGEIVDKGRYDVLYSFENGVYQTLISNEIEDMDKLVDSVIEQIKEDIKDGDLTAIDELLRFVPKENLIGYLPEKI
jgi:ribonuclease HIII